MYFAADGNRRLTRFHQKRVSAESDAVRKKEPLELKMPMDDGKEMTVTEGFWCAQHDSNAQPPGS